MEPQTIAQKLRSIRKACGFTQQQIAAVLNVDRSTYTYYETGKTTPDIHTVKILAELFNVSVDTLLSDEISAGALGDSEAVPHSQGNTDLPETANRLTRAERELLLYYRALPPQERADAVQLLREKLDAVNEQQEKDE